MNGAETVAHVGGVLEELGFLEESITFGRARWVILADNGQESSITMTIDESGEIRVVVAVKRLEGDGNVVDVTSTGTVNGGLLGSIFPNSGRLTMATAVEFIVAYARLLAFRPTAPTPEPETRPIPPGSYRV